MHQTKAYSNRARRSRMVTRRTKAVFFGHDNHIALGFLFTGLVVGMLIGSGLALPLYPPTATLVPAIAIGFVALYAYLNDGLAICWLVTFAVWFGYLYFNPTTPPHVGDWQMAIFGALIQAPIWGSLSFLTGAGIRECARRIGISGRLLPRSGAPLFEILFGPEYRKGIRPISLGFGLALLLGVIAILVKPTAHLLQAELISPQLVSIYSGIFLLSAFVAWNDRGLLPALVTPYVAVLGLITGLVLGPTNGFEMFVGAPWVAFLLTFTFGVPGLTVGHLFRGYLEPFEESDIVT